MSNSDFLLSSQIANEDDPDSKKPDSIIQIARRRFQLIVGGAALGGAILAFILLSIFGRSALTINGNVDALLGEKVLTQEELFSLVAENNLTAYWVGPLPGMKYSLTVTADKQIFVKYLPDGNGLTDSTPIYRVIATYPEPGAYDITRAAGTQANAVTFINDDGAAVYYSKDRPTNVYVAYSGINYEIEIFDPDAATALSLGTIPGTVQRIE